MFYTPPADLPTAADSGQPGHCCQLGAESNVYQLPYYPTEYQGQVPHCSKQYSEVILREAHLSNKIVFIYLHNVA